MVRNTQSHFYNKFLTPIHLDDDNWEAGLSELSFINSFDTDQDNLSGKFYFFDFLFRHDDGKYGKLYEFVLERGFCPTPKAVLDFINTSISEKVPRLKDTPFIRYTEKLDRFWFDFVDQLWGTFIIMGDMLRVMGVTDEKVIPASKEIILGLTKKAKSYEKDGTTRYFENHREYKTDVPKTDIFEFPPLRYPYDSIYVYCDAIQDVITGAEMTQLFRVVTIKGNVGTRVTITFDLPHYVPLRVKYIPSIRLELRDQAGEYIRFSTGGYVRAKIHFKKKSLY